ncbi:septation protein SepH [Rothia nasimurium]|uniref:septation protein SepH n=1 Tax=Rothia nasimurium TaxID=85336 RepID=UPI003BA1129B
MQELRLAGIHDDGEHLVLESAEGTTYLLPIDQDLRQSIARARRINPMRGGKPGEFGPRDIQTRFRQGASVEEIAAESGWEPERIRRYEWPIVAERANIIRTAQAVMVSPVPGQAGNTQPLSHLVASVAQAHGFSADDLDWSTWQQESGQWTVSADLTLPADGSLDLPRSVMFPARWTFNPANQSIYATNEAAYFLLDRQQNNDGPIPGQVPAQTSSPAPAAEALAAEPSPSTASPAPAENSRLKAVRVPESTEQNELLDELTARRGVRSFDPASERKLADLLERARRSSKTSPVAEATPAQVEREAPTEQAPRPDHAADSTGKEPEQAPASAQAPVETTPEPTGASAQADNSTSSAASVAPAHEPSPTAESAPLPAAERVGKRFAPVTPEAETQPENQPEEAVAPSTSQAPADQPPAQPQAHESQASDVPEEESKAPARPARAKRTSVPSWDDIIFGNQRR